MEKVDEALSIVALLAVTMITQRRQFARSISLISE